MMVGMVTNAATAPAVMILHHCNEADDVVTVEWCRQWWAGTEPVESAPVTTRYRLVVSSGAWSPYLTARHDATEVSVDHLSGPHDPAVEAYVRALADEG